MFDENLTDMVFPKVKEFSFRASSDHPLQVAAKALACRNEHPDLWKCYSFSVLRQRITDEGEHVAVNEEVHDLKKSFAMLKEKID